MFSALSLLVWDIQMLGRCCYRHSAGDLILKTCTSSAAQWHAFTDPAQRMCAATGVRQRPAIFCQQISCRSKSIQACRRQKKTRDHAGSLWLKTLAPSRCFPKKKSTGLPFFFLHKCTTMSCSTDRCCRKSCCLCLTRPHFPDLQAVCNTPLQRIDRSVRYTF